MRHFSCDLCSKDLTPGADARFVVRMEAFPVVDPRELTEADLDRDHVEAMAELLDQLEDADPTAAPSPTCRKMEYDLCPVCYRKFLEDPLGREQARKLHFSQN